jgi:hypothetical protein
MNNKMNWLIVLVFIVLVACIAWLVVRDLTRAGTLGVIGNTSSHRGLELVTEHNYIKHLLGNVGV